MCEFVYKLVARAESDAPDAPMLAVAKKSVNKISVGGRKFALRRLSKEGVAEAEIIGVGEPPGGDLGDRRFWSNWLTAAPSLARNPLRLRGNVTCRPAPSCR